MVTKVDGAGTGGVGEEAGTAADLGRQQLAVEPAQALHGGCAGGVIEEDRGLAQHVVPGEGREGNQGTVEVELEVAAHGLGTRQSEAVRGHVVLEEAGRGHRTGGQHHAGQGSSCRRGRPRLLDAAGLGLGMEEAHDLLLGQSVKLGRLQMASIRLRSASAL